MMARLFLSGLCLIAAMPQAAANDEVASVSSRQVALGPPCVTRPSSTTNDKATEYKDISSSVKTDANYFASSLSVIIREVTEGQKVVGEERVEYWARLREIKFDHLSHDGNQFLRITCSQRFGCISARTFQRKSDGVFYVDTSVYLEKIEVPVCKNDIAQIVGNYNKLGESAARSSPPDIAEGRAAAASSNERQQRQFLMSYPGSVLASGVRNALRSAVNKNEPLPSYDEFIEKDEQPYWTLHEVDVFLGPSTQFERIGLLHQDEQLDVIGHVGDGDSDDSWVAIKFREAVRFVERSKVIREAAHTDLELLKKRRDAIQHLLAQSNMGKYATVAGVYGFKCTGMDAFPGLNDWFARKAYLFEKFVLVTTGDQISLIFAKEPLGYKTFTLKPAKKVDLPGIGLTQTYQVTFTRGKDDFSEVAFPPSRFLFGEFSGSKIFRMQLCGPGTDREVWKVWDREVNDYQEQ